MEGREGGLGREDKKETCLQAREGVLQHLSQGK